MEKIAIDAGGAFDLRNTFDCGQCFRWNESPDSSWTGVVMGERLTVRETDGEILLEGERIPELWREYFDLDTDYDSIRSEIREHCPGLVCAVDSIDGIRILSQEPWEALCSFIISQNNNIPRIKGIIERLCENFGDSTGDWYTFPDAERLAALSPEELAPIRAGFRARYIIDAAQKVASGKVELEKLRTLPLDESRRSLMTITGVGVKVADCTLLYGLHRMDAFPVDVWMKKALASLFSGVSPEDIGRYAGVAQQYIFHYSRLHPESVG